MSRGLGSGRLERGESYGGDRKVYFGIWTDARLRRRKQILSSDKRVAERALAKIIRDRDLEVLGLKDEEGQSVLLADLRDRYLQDLALRAKSTQVRRITGILRRLIDDYLGAGFRVRDLRVENLLAYQALRSKQGMANRTVNLETGALRSMLKWALECQLIGRNPVETLRPLPTGKAHEKKPRRALSRDEIDTLVKTADEVDDRVRARWAAEKSKPQRNAEYADRKRQRHVPQAPLWRTLVFTGARWGELTATVWADYDVKERSLRLRPETTKSAKIRVLPLVTDVADALDGLREIHAEVLGHEPRPDEHIFLGPRGRPVKNAYRRALYRFQELLKEAGIPELDELGRKVDIHALRHSFASELGRAGVGLTQAQALMGHSDPKLTAALYTHLGVEDLRGAVDRLERRA